MFEFLGLIAKNFSAQDIGHATELHPIPKQNDGKTDDEYLFSKTYKACGAESQHLPVTFLKAEYYEAIKYLKSQRTMGKESDLLHAVKNGEVSYVRKALQKFRSNNRNRKGGSKKSNINQQDADGFTVLHHAALVGNAEVVMALIEMEADPNARDKKGMTPLHMGAWAGKDQVVKSLLENRGLVNLPSFSGETPLHLAAQHGYSSVVDYLLKFRADATIRNNDLETPLDLACKFGHTAVVRFLLMKEEVIVNLRSRNEDPRYKSPLHLASKSGHPDVVRLLIEGGADVNEESSQGTALHLASLYGKIEVVSLLLEAGADVHVVNKNGMTPIDVVNQFTTSRAGIEIKQMLREAAGERVVYARAVADYNNVYDPTSLPFKTGETITLIEQNENGRWKGSIIDGQEERVGYFPATAVLVISRQQQQQQQFATSSNSMSSSNSSLSSLSGKDHVPAKQPEEEEAMKDDYAEDDGPGKVLPLSSFYHEPLGG